MARPKAAEHDIRREAILQHAAACFAEKGYAAASMSDISAACGTSKARLYHYYASKDALLFDLLDAYTALLVSLIDEVLLTPAASSARTARKQLHELIRRFLLAYENSTNRHIALVSSVSFLPRGKRVVILNRQRKMIHAFSELIALAYPESKPAELMPRTMMLFGMINWTFTWLRAAPKSRSSSSTSHLTHAQFAELVIDTLEHGFSPR